MANNLVSITEGEFDEFIKANDKVVVDFWATWCSPCMAMNPIIEDLAKKYDGKVAFAKVNVEENGTLASRYGIQAIPAFIFIKDGGVAGIAKGLLQRSKLEEEIQDAFGL